MGAENLSLLEEIERSADSRNDEVLSQALRHLTRAPYKARRCDYCVRLRESEECSRLILELEDDIEFGRISWKAYERTLLEFRKLRMEYLARMSILGHCSCLE